MPQVAEVEEWSGHHLDACLHQGLADGVLVIDHEPEVATVIWWLTARPLKREELIAQIDEGHILTFPTKLEYK